MKTRDDKDRLFGTTRRDRLIGLGTAGTTGLFTAARSANKARLEQFDRYTRALNRLKQHDAAIESVQSWVKRDPYELDRYRKWRELGKKYPEYDRMADDWFEYDKGKRDIADPALDLLKKLRKRQGGAVFGELRAYAKNPLVRLSRSAGNMYTNLLGLLKVAR